MKPIFKSYPDIENSYREKFVDLFKKEVNDTEYFITEKIHGANSQIAFFRDGDKWQVKYGKRTSFLNDQDSFYNLPSVFQRLMPHFTAFLQGVIDNSPDGHILCDGIIFYGEIFGGAYPHKGIDKESDLLPHNAGTNRVVQHGVWYCPEDDWACFDICILTDNNWTFVHQSFLFHQCEKYGIPTVPLLAVVSTIDEALAYPNDRQSVVYQRYGLPRIENNIMEGVVIKPGCSVYLSSNERAVIKNKNDHFKEVHHHKIARTIEPGSAEALLIEEAKDYVTEARMDNVISKFGEVDRKDIGKIIGLLGKDACDEFMKDHEGDLNLLTEEQQKQVKKVFGGEAAKLVREKLVPTL